MSSRTRIALLTATLLAPLVTACGPTPEASGTTRPADRPAATAVVRDTVVTAMLEAAGSAEPYQQAVLSTRLMGTILQVLVREGDAVAEGATLVRVDARDLDARRAQVAAQAAEAQAVRREAQVSADRIRRLYAESVATRAQLDAVETGLARADAAVRMAQAGAAEVEAAAGYAEVRAPFAGLVARRQVDPGAFASPGAPLVTIEDVSRLRVTASAAPDAVRALRRGQVIEATIEDVPVSAVVEGIVPAPGGSTWEVNAVVDNRARRFLAHSAATLRLPQGTEHLLVVPAAAVVRDGDLAGVDRRVAGRFERRWVRIGRTVGAGLEVLAGLAGGDSVAVPAVRVR
jgi:RND family efflux transporter MFP subunit